MVTLTVDIPKSINDNIDIQCKNLGYTKDDGSVDRSAFVAAAIREKLVKGVDQSIDINVLIQQQSTAGVKIAKDIDAAFPPKPA